MLEKMSKLSLRRTMSKTVGGLSTYKNVSAQDEENAVLLRTFGIGPSRARRPGRRYDSTTQEVQYTLGC